MFDWLFRNRTTGAITVGQFPNLSITVFLAGTVVAWLAGPEGRVAFWAGILAKVALVWWAGDEVLRGVNPWRRFLGAGVLLYVAAKLVRTGGWDGIGA